MRRCLSALTLAALTAACGGGGPAAPPALAYRLPDPAAVTYIQGDTTELDIEGGGQSFQMSVGSAATLDAAFARSDEGVSVTLTVKKFSARMDQPMGGAITADESQISGPLVFTLDRRGRTSIVSRPETKGPATQFFGALSLAHSFFPRLPGRAIGPGDEWTDTIRYSGKEGQGQVDAVIVAHYTAVSDTTVAGRSLLKIAMTGTSDLHVTGVTAGMDVSQDLTGKLEGVILWDPVRGLMAESSVAGDARGPMEVSAAPFPLNVRARQRTTIRLAS